MRRALVLALLAGCPSEPVDDEVQLGRITNAPPASIATVINDHVDGVFHVDLSVGVAMAVSCWDNCGERDYSSYCTGAKIVIDDETVLGVRPLYRATAADRSDFVLVATRPGLTTLHVETNCAARDYALNVVPR